MACLLQIDLNFLQESLNARYEIETHQHIGIKMTNFRFAFVALKYVLYGIIGRSVQGHNQN